MVGKHVHVVFEVLTELVLGRILQQRRQLREDLVPVELCRGAGIVVCQGDIGRSTGSHRERHPHHPGAAVIEIVGFGVEGEKIGVAQCLEPSLQRALIHYALVYRALARQRRLTGTGAVLFQLPRQIAEFQACVEIAQALGVR